MNFMIFDACNIPTRNTMMRRKVRILLCLYISLAGITCQPRQARQDSRLETTEFLHKYGYMQNANPSSKPLDPRGRGPEDPEATRQAILAFQTFNGLNKTGEIDEPTLALMMSPRCGNPDVQPLITSRRKKRYKFNGSQWKQRVVTWKLTDNTPQLPREFVTKTLDYAFKIWSRAANINFERTDGRNYDIEVKFGKGVHGDRFPFDGRGRVLAHAFSPRAGGDVHFDDDEPWTATISGRNLLAVATHEIGHSLGMSHSRDKAAVMAPYYKTVIPGRFGLQSDDIAGIRELYGERKSTTKGTTTTITTTTTTATTTTTTRPTTKSTVSTSTTKRPTWPWRTPPPTFRPTPYRPDKPTTYFYPWWQWGRAVTTLPPWMRSSTTTDPTTTTTTTAPTSTSTKPTTSTTQPEAGQTCQPVYMDAAVSLPNTDAIYTFKDNRYLRIGENGIERGYPKSTLQRFPGVAWGVDAGFSFKDGTGQDVIYLFKGWMAWKFDLNFNPLYRGYREIWREFPGLNIGAIDAAFHWQRNNKTYLFQGDKYYKFDRNNRMEPGYPRDLSTWTLPSRVRRIDAAISWSANKDLYFFTADKYYKYDHLQRSVASPRDAPAYPRPVSTWWYGCRP